MAGNEGEAAARHRSRVAQNNDQLRVAEHLIATVRDRLAGRDPEGRELVGMRPRERVVLGVLLPQLPSLVVTESTASPVPYESGVPADNLPASEMGLAALIEPDGTEITLHVRGTFALYLQHAPRHDQQLAQSGLDNSDCDAHAGDRNESADADTADVADTSIPSPSDGQDLTVPPEPTAEELSSLPP